VQKTSHRYERSSMILTSNLTFGSWDAAFDHQCKLYRQGIVASDLSCWSAFRKAIGLAEVGVNMVNSGVWRTICESARDKFSDVALAPHAGQLYWLEAWEEETH
jgi:hypothetical protein